MNLVSECTSLYCSYARSPESMELHVSILRGPNRQCTKLNPRNVEPVVQSLQSCSAALQVPEAAWAATIRYKAIEGCPHTGNLIFPPHCAVTEIIAQLFQIILFPQRIQFVSLCFFYKQVHCFRNLLVAYE